nr:hypothetical protein Iba_chr10aCG13550 [Ipomoea batatas]
MRKLGEDEMHELGELEKMKCASMEKKKTVWAETNDHRHRRCRRRRLWTTAADSQKDLAWKSTAAAYAVPSRADRSSAFDDLPSVVVIAGASVVDRTQTATEKDGPKRFVAQRIREERQRVGIMKLHT